MDIGFSLLLERKVHFPKEVAYIIAFGCAFSPQCIVKIVSFGNLGKLRDAGIRSLALTAKDLQPGPVFQRTVASSVRSLWVARNRVFLMVPSVVFSIPA